MKNLKKLERDLNRLADGEEISGKGAQELKYILQESASVVSEYANLLEGEDLMTDKKFLRDLFLYIREGNQNLQLIKEIKLGLLNSQSERSKNTIKQTALMLVSKFKEQKLEVAAALSLLAVAANLNDSSLISRAKGLVRGGATEEE